MAQPSRPKVWWEVLALPTWRWVVLIPIAVLGTFQLFRDELLSPETAEKYKLPTLLSGMSWHWWIVILLVLILIILMESTYRTIKRREDKIAVLEDRLTPKLSAVYDQNKPPCHSVSEFRFSDGRAPINGMVYRIEVENIGAEMIHDCEGFLTEVAFEDEAAELGAMNLTWSGMYPLALRVDLRPNVKRHLDLIVIYEDGRVSIISPGWPPNNRQDFFSRRGHYRFTVVIGGAESTLPPYKVCLDHTDGDWQTSTMEPI
jgi:hypothetical protein